MGEMHLIEGALKRAARRRRLVAAWRGLWTGLLYGAALWLLVFGVFKFYPIPKLALTVAAAAAGAVAVAFVLAAFFKRHSLIQTARWVDNRQNLKERLSTALELSKTNGESEWKELVVRDAADHANAIDARKLLPFSWPSLAKWAVLLLVLGVGLGFIPEYRTKAFQQKQKDAVVIRDVGKKLEELAKRTIEQKKPALEPTQKALADVAEVGNELQKANLTRSQALRDLASVSEKLKEQARELGDNPAFKALERASRESSGSGNQSAEALQQKIDALQKSMGNAAANSDKLDKISSNMKNAQKEMAKLPDKDSAAAQLAREQMSQALSELSKELSDMGQALPMLDEAIKALQNNQTDLAMRDLDQAATDLEKLREMAKKLEKLQKQMAQLGKDLPEQLKNGQASAAQKSLEKMAEQLKSGNVSEEQMQKMLDEVSRAVDPGKQYGKLGEMLKDAAGQMKSGQKSEAGQSLAKAAQELQKLAQQMADAQAMTAAMQALDQAQMAIGAGMSWDQVMAENAEFMGKAYEFNPNGGNGPPGSKGVGTWADEEGWTYFDGKQERWDNSEVERPDMDARGVSERSQNLNNNLLPTKVKGQMSPGGAMPSITLKGVSIKGQSTIQFQDAAAAAQAEAESALNQDLVPRAYQNTVRDYFDDIKK
ncbi:MAG TPA: hypothetical protein VJ063_09660 [Verrucomicrobiae bacterium]|nr:hypothetical protein [Verrucomicrobiae bacterium]